MSFNEFIEEKISFILINILFMFILSIYLYFLNIQINIILILNIIWFLIFIAFLIISYLKIKKKYQTIINLTNELDEKYLIYEVLPKTTNIENKAYIYALKKACKAMNDKISDTQKKYQNYQEYIESFVHEIKTPISAISLMSENENNKIAKEEIKKIENLCEQILYFSRSKNPENDYFIKEVYLEDIIHKVLLEYRNIILKNKITINVHDLNKQIFTDEKWLTFIIKQIIQNSIKYLDKKNKIIEIYATNEKNSVKLIIKDNGIGIHDYDLEKIYDYGFTGSDRQKTHSTGIGLYLVKKLCDKLNIGINTQSKYKEYTKTEIILPKTNSYILK